MRLASGNANAVPNRTIAQDVLGAIPFGDALKVGGKVLDSTALGPTIDHAGNFGLVDSWAGLFGDPTALGYFKPDGGRQAAEMFIPGGGGPMMVALENAWKTGSGKDRAAR
ncbi:hypothetical protein [Streptomyces boninensis]|uniref:hypothetical protein n=1 Tax=Streptomyces boninensis TaxID=2039455 RepID=UPI003B216B24